MLLPSIETLESAYMILARHRIYPDKVIHGCSASSIQELSEAMPISIETGIDRVLQHADIRNPDDWEVIVKKMDPVTGSWKEIPDPRIYREDFDIT